MASDLAIFDQAFALNQFSGNQALLDKLLTRFCEDYHDFDVRLQRWLETAETAEAKTQVHTLKGVAGNLGMPALQHCCKSLEGALATGQIAPTLDKFLATLGATLTHLQTPTNNAPTETDNRQSPAGLDPLIARLERFEFVSNNDVEASLAQLADGDLDKAAIKTAIADLDYERALALLRP